MNEDRIAVALDILKNWRPDGLQTALRSYYVKQDAHHTRCSIQILIGDLPNTDMLFDSVMTAVGPKGVEELVNHLFYSDPSPDHPIAEQDVQAAIEKKPFPSYFVGIAYLFALDHPKSIPGTSDALLFSLENKKNIYWSETLYGLLANYFSRDFIMARAAQWLMSDDPFLRFVGDNLVYTLNPTGQEAKDLIESYRTAIRKSGKDDRKQLMKSLRKLEKGELFWSTIEAGSRGKAAEGLVLRKCLQVAEWIKRRRH